ncbi:MAG: transposase [Thiotrichales bacterium]
MEITAAHLVDNVLPQAPLRQVVVSFPKWLRYYLERDAGLLGRVIRIVQSEVERALIQHSPDAPTGSCAGGIVFIHRFGSSLNAHPHLHLVVIDGVIARTGERLSFHPARLGPDAAKALREAIRLRVLRLFQRRGLFDAQVIDNLRAWSHGGGFSVHAEVRVPAWDKAGRERLLRDCARPIFASERLTWIREGERLRYRLARPDLKGRTELILTPDELIDRIAALIPPPRKHRLRYFGVLAPNSPWRKAVTTMDGGNAGSAGSGEQCTARAGRPVETGVAEQQIESTTPQNDSQESNATIRFGVSLWAKLPLLLTPLTYVHVGNADCPNLRGLSVDLSQLWRPDSSIASCNRCISTSLYVMRIIAFIEAPESIRRILRTIGEPTEPSRIHPPRAPPDWPQIEQTIMLDEEINQDHYDFEFDQSVSW